uniref:Uncharacterized protein n=1 Tax=Meloidogyne enterolobii TaxID=390850 RepID=A0A6V7TR52_MELEN|nr:unnamed protein product [Meloidogyne enterolobii]
MEVNTTSQTPPVFPQVTYINFSIYTVALFCTLTTVFNMSRLLYASRYNKSSLVSELSSTMILYLAVNVMCATSTLPYLFYKVLWWRPPFLRGTEPVYSATLFHFISGIFYALHYAVSSILVFILCLDRCLLIKTGITHWNGKKRRMFFIAGIIILVIVYVGVGASYSLEFPLDYDILIHCETQSCMQLRLKNYPMLITKTSFGIANIICCIVFLRLLSQLGGEAIKKLVGKSLSFR